MISVQEAISRLRADPKFAQLIHDSYLDGDALACAERFASSAEFEQVQELLSGRIRGADILDLGAGTGIASFAFACAGAACVFALEPDLSDITGCAVIRRITAGLTVQVLSAVGEAIPLAERTVDIVYARQVLHHTRDLPRVLRECARVLRPGGVFLACREHVADNVQQLKAFLASHPVHRLAGGEHAFPLHSYIAAIQAAGLRLEKIIGPWDSVINAFPAVRSNTELQRFARTKLEQKFGRLGVFLAAIPVAETVVWAWLKRPTPGRMYSFLASKPC
jgi:SAM-dependent methyltransferase